MSSKAEKRRSEFEKREEKRAKQRKRQQAIRDANGIEELAAAMGVRLK